MDRFRALAVFAQVVEQGNLARAADKLGLSTSAVSRHLAELEAHVGARLVNRTTRRLSLTESGQALYERAVQLLADLDEAEAVASAGSAAPRGTVKLTCSTAFGVRHVGAPLAAFAARHPHVRFELELSDRVVDIVDEGLDLAIRIGDVGALTLIGRRLGVSQLICCASPAYLARHGTPATPADLAHHACLTYAYATTSNAWRFRAADGDEQTVRVTGPAHANNGEMLASLAVAGLGITLEPDFIVAPELRRGALVPLLAGYAPPATAIHAVYPSRRHLSAKVRVLVDFLVEYFAANATWRIAPAVGGH
ncbi:MAG: LysR family transcriptional regulator [Proteobacteria bacterium]|nr:LysR family transcriptional regulator [Pseudomonadota bacterium]